METKTVGLIAILCLLIGLLGIIGTVIVPQNLNILLLALLAIWVFLENHKKFMDTFYGSTIGMGMKALRVLIIIVIVIGFAFYIFSNWGVWTPVFMAVLSIGLFFANRSFNRLQNPEA